MMFGRLEKPALRTIADLGMREIAVFLPLVGSVIYFGFYPAPVFDVTAVSVKRLVSSYEAAVREASRGREAGRTATAGPLAAARGAGR
jgi:NADH-quinone oxidoreductase subunit M